MVLRQVTTSNFNATVSSSSQILIAYYDPVSAAYRDLREELEQTAEALATNTALAGVSMGTVDISIHNFLGTLQAVSDPSESSSPSSIGQIRNEQLWQLQRNSAKRKNTTLHFFEKSLILIPKLSRVMSILALFQMEVPPPTKEKGVLCTVILTFRPILKLLSFGLAERLGSPPEWCYNFWLGRPPNLNLADGSLVPAENRC
eukprot:2400651-Amphidinium_carterae.1